jgi:hypothetical protein
MRRHLILFALTIPALSACGGAGGGADSKVTETRMDDIDSVEGTISDEMVDTDENSEMAPVEASAPAADKPKAKSGDKKDVKAEDKPAKPAEDKAEAESE